MILLDLAVIISFNDIMRLMNIIRFNDITRFNGH